MSVWKSISTKIREESQHVKESQKAMELDSERRALYEQCLRTVTGFISEFEKVSEVCAEAELAGAYFRHLIQVPQPVQQEQMAEFGRQVQMVISAVERYRQ